MSKLKLSELVKQMMEQPEVAPEPTTKPSKPSTKPGKPNPLRWPKEAPKPAPKAEKEVIDDLLSRYFEDEANLNEKTSKYSLSEMLSEISLDGIKDKFVGRGKVVDDKQFTDIMKATGNKLAISLWMIKRIQDGFILPEDIYKWEDYLDIFKRVKREFPVKDINQIKTEDDIDDFVNKAIEIQDREADPSKKKGVAKEDKYDSFKIGDVAGYKAYKIPPTNKMSNDEIQALYGVSCDLGSGTQWCTASGNTDSWFKNYSKKGPLYIFIGPDGKKYQFQYEGNDFMDKNDRSVLRRDDVQEATPEVGEFFKFLRDKEKKEIPLKAQFAFTPENIDWENLAYDENDLNLIKDTNSMDNIVWDKVPQNTIASLRWIINNAPDKLDASKIDPNAAGVVGLLAKSKPEIINWDGFVVDSYAKAMQGLRAGKDKIDWSTQVDYNNFPTMKFMAKHGPELIDKSKIEDEKIAALFS